MASSSDSFGFDQQQPAPTTASAWRHPIAVYFHMFFRVCAIVAYLICLFVSDNFVLNFVTIVSLLSLDFWTVKNVTGRMLVGLRWWNQVAEDGSSKWLFESKPSFVPHPSEANLFWWSLYLFEVFWGIFALTCLLKLNFSYLIIVVVAISLNTANLIGYRKCDTDARNRATNAGNTSGGSAPSVGSALLERAAGSIGSIVASSLMAPKQQQPQSS
eukprot:m.84433 g.84433  ORF g.84433 m.84433 type:complete len:215 (-) comp50824_c0_seq1:80-724(-)